MRVIMIMCQPRCIFAALLMLAALFQESYSIVLYEPAPLRVAVDDAQLIVRGTVERIDAVTYHEGTEQHLCGKNILMSVAETLKGASAPSLMISVFMDPLSGVYQPVKRGDEILVLAAGHDDHPDPAMDEIPDVIDESPSDEKKRCLRKLSPLRPFVANESAFRIVTRQPEGTTRPLKWFAYDQHLTIVPMTVQELERPFDESCEGAACRKDVRRMVPWLAIREYIQFWTENGAKSASRPK